MERLIGIGVSAGVAWGPAVLLMQHPLALRYSVARDRVAREEARLEAARDASRRQLREIRTRVTRGGGAELGHLFEVQILMLDDALLVPRAAAIIAADRVNAEWAVERAFEEFCEIFREVDDPYFAERRGDVADVVGRLQRNLQPARSYPRELLLELDQPSILVADDLPPSIAGQLDRRRVLGLAVDTGSRTHHTAILARSLKLPAVVGLGGASARIAPGAMIIVDGFTGEVVVDPPADLLAEVQARAAGRSRAEVQVAARDRVPIASADGVPVRFGANIELAEDLVFARASGAEGVGLFRSEFLLAGRPVRTFGEDLQYAAYRDLLERMAPSPVTVRTFDLDELQASGRSSGEADAPARGEDLSRGPLGLRGIRLSLSQLDLFRTQLRALVRASRHGQLRILFPFVSAVEELREARAVLRSVIAECEGPGAPLAPIPVGIMIEVPSAALTADLLAEEADFFSIGTNDLIQYCLAVDRTDGRVARLYEPLHPAILRVVRSVARVAARRGRPVEVCGEMASDQAAMLLLLGLGVTEFSMNPAAIPAARRLVTSVRVRDLRAIARRALRMPTARDIERYLTTALGPLQAPDGEAAPWTGGQGVSRER